MGHVLIQARGSDAVLLPCHWVFLRQPPLQIHRAKAVGEQKAIAPKLTNHWVNDVLTQCLQGWQRLLQVFRKRVNLVSKPLVGLRAGAKFL
jgi:hypothetical protein